MELHVQDPALSNPGHEQSCASTDRLQEQKVHTPKTQRRGKRMEAPDSNRGLDVPCQHKEAGKILSSINYLKEYLLWNEIELYK